MKWLLLVFIFDISNGGMKLIKDEQKVFATEDACNAAGKVMADTTDYPGDTTRSMSMCIPESAFDE